MPEDIFDDLFEAHLVHVRRYAERRVSGASLVEDIVAETFAAAWMQVRQGHNVNLAWLYRVARNKIVDHYRFQERERTVQAMNLDAQIAYSHETDVVNRLALAQALTTLSERDLEVIRLTYWEQLSAREIAKVLNISLPATWAILSRSRKRLKLTLHEKVDERTLLARSELRD